MELGTAVFLSSIAVCVVLLYGFTKDRWSWRRIIFRTLIGIVGLAVIGGTLIVAAQYWDQLVPIKLARQTEYAGVRLGMSRDEVKYVKGVPPNVVTDDKDGPWQAYGVLKSSELPQGKAVNDYPLWSYEGYEHYLHVAFGKGGRSSAFHKYSQKTRFIDAQRLAASRTAHQKPNCSANSEYPVDRKLRTRRNQLDTMTSAWNSHLRRKRFTDLSSVRRHCCDGRDIVRRQGPPSGGRRARRGCGGR